MIRGATAQFTFKLPKELNIDDISYIDIVAWQKGYKGTPSAPLPIKRTYTNSNWDSNIVADEHTLVVKFTSSDTSRFTDKLKGYIQCKVVVTGEVVYPTYEQRFTVYPMYDALVGGDIDGEIQTSDGWIILDGQEIMN
jgi:hypothetical protein